MRRSGHSDKRRLLASYPHPNYRRPASSRRYPGRPISASGLAVLSAAAVTVVRLMTCKLVQSAIADWSAIHWNAATTDARLQLLYVRPEFCSARFASQFVHNLCTNRCTLGRAESTAPLAIGYRPIAPGCRFKALKLIVCTENMRGGLPSPMESSSSFTR